MYKDRMVELIEKIEANSNHFDWKMWAQRGECGTTYCMAGHAAILAGWEPSFADDSKSTSTCTKNYVARGIQEVAAEYLGLTDDQAHKIFIENCAEASIDDIRDIVEDATGESLTS